MKLINRTILLTGGSAGIGLELTRQLLARSNVVIITGRDQARLDAAKAAHPALHTVQADISDPASITRLHATISSQFPNSTPSSTTPASCATSTSTSPTPSTT